MRCTNPDGFLDVYTVVAQSVGASYSATIWEGTLTNGVRATWDNQIPQTAHGVTIRWSAGGHTGDPFWTKSATHAGCGQFLGFKGSSDPIHATIDFAGLDVEIQTSDTMTDTLSIEVTAEDTFTIGVGLGDAVKVGFGVTGSTAISHTTTLTYHSTESIWEATGG
jgi:hypothetical protein